MNDSTSDTPTGRVAATQSKVLVTDARGRVIAVKKLTALDYYQLTKAMGESATNPVLMDLAITAASVTRIDTTDLAFPRSEKDVEFAIQFLDFDGVKAAGEGLRQLNPKVDEGAEAAKNSPGDPISS